jgi:hypothetical protein
MLQGLATPERQSAFELPPRSFSRRFNGANPNLQSGLYTYLFSTQFDPSRLLTWSLNEQLAEIEARGVNPNVNLPVCPAALVPASFGLIRFGSRQTLRLKVVDNSSTKMCGATLSFGDQNAAQIGPAVKAVSLAYGRAAQLDLTSMTLNVSLGQRVEIQPLIATVDQRTGRQGALGRSSAEAAPFHSAVAR